MKKSIFLGLVFLMMPLVVMGHFGGHNKEIQWEVYRTQVELNEKKGDIYKVKGRISSFKLENMKDSIEIRHILTTEDRRSIDLEASGVDVNQIKKFVRGKPVEVFLKGVKGKQDFLWPLQKGITSHSSLMEGVILEIRQDKKWMYEQQKKLLKQQNEQNYFYDKSRTVSVGFISINIQGREGNTTVTQDTLDSFKSHVEAMTYGKIKIDTSMDNVHHINRSDTPLLNCNNPSELIGWAYERLFPPTYGLIGGGYNRVFIIYPFGSNDNCNWAGITNLVDFNTNEYASVTGSGNIIVRAGENRVMEMVHEFGHTLGMKHSAMDTDNDGVISLYEEYADPECGMATTPLAFNPIHMHKSMLWRYYTGGKFESSPLLGIGYGLVSAADGERYQLASPLLATPLANDAIHAHPALSTNRNLPRTVRGENLAVIVRNKYYVNRSIEDEDFVYIRQHISGRSNYDSLVVEKVRIGNMFRFPDSGGDGICVIGENSGNARLYVTYHSNMASNHVCASPEGPENISEPVTPSLLELVESFSVVSTNKAPVVRVGGIRSGDLVEIYKDEDCNQKVGFGISKGASAEIKISELLSPGNYEFYARAGASASKMSSCSTAYVQYGVLQPLAPNLLTLVKPLVSSSVENAPTVRVEGGGIQNQDVLRLYTDRKCQNEASHPVVAKGSIVDIKSYRLPEGQTHNFFVRYTRNGTNASQCWNSGVSYTVIEDPNRESYRGPSINMPGNGYLLPRFPDFSGNEDSDDVFFGNVGRVVQPVFENQAFLNRPMFSGARAALYTDSECRTEVASTPVVSRVWYPDGDLDRTRSLRIITSGRTVNLKSPPLEPGVHTFYAKTWQNGRDGTIDAEFSECTRWGYTYTLLPPLLNPPIIVRPAAPSAVSVRPAGVRAHRNSMPTFRVEGVQLGDIVTLHEDSECLLRLDDSWNKKMLRKDQDFVNIQSFRLNVGKYNVYAKINRNGVESACSTAFASYERLAPIPSMVSTLTMSDPHGENSGTDNTPTIRVNNINIGSLVGIYTDSNCTTKVGEVESTDWSGVVEVTTQPLSLGSYTFYTKLVRDGRESDCSTESIDYEVIGDGSEQVDNISDQINNENEEVSTKPDAPSFLKLIKPKKDRSKKTRPLIEVRGVQNSDIVRIFIDDQCTQKVGAGTVLKRGSVRIRSDKLSPGSYTFYANTTRNGVVSNCSTASVNYEVLKK